MYLPEVKQAVELVWRSWHGLEKRKAFQHEIPSFLSCNYHIGQPVGTADFNKFLMGRLGHMVSNAKLLSSYCLRRVQPTALDIRDASWEDRHKVAAWSMPGTRMEDCMPVRYSGARAAGEVEGGFELVCGPVANIGLRLALMGTVAALAALALMGSASA